MGLFDQAEKEKKERKGPINQNQYDTDAFVFPVSLE